MAAIHQQEARPKLGVSLCKKNKRRGVSGSPTFISGTRIRSGAGNESVCGRAAGLRGQRVRCDAVHEAGGPATAVAVTVTFCEGEKPCAVPLPEK